MKLRLVIILTIVMLGLSATVPLTVTASTNPYEGCPTPGMINTALGCIPVKTGLTFDSMAFIKWVIRNMVYVASGIAFLLMVFGGIRILTSAGSPESVKAGSELITAALTGLLFIIFSILILRLIGTDILQLPGFGN